MKNICRKPPEGFTLIEALLAAVILAMAITAILMPFTSGAQSQRDDARRTAAVGLAQEMMEEVLTKPFYDPHGPNSQRETIRSQFDNMADYDNFDEPEGQLMSFDGQSISNPAVTGLSRHVTAAYVYVDGQVTSDPPTFMRITVDIRYKGSLVVTLNRLVFANR